MRQKIYAAILLVGVTISNVEAQITLPFNNGATGSQYVGWDVNQPFPLTIKHERANQPINLQTNTGAGGLAKIRMQISNTTVNAPNGASFEVGRVQIRENPLNPEFTTKN
jgi:hypothetical protein